MFEKLRNKEIMNIIWDRLNLKEDISSIDQVKSRYNSIHEMTGDIAGNLIKEVLKRESTDNLTAVVISLNGLKRFYENTGVVNNNAFTVQQISKTQKEIKPQEKKEEKNSNILSKFQKVNTANKHMQLVSLKDNKNQSENTSNVSIDSTKNKITVRKDKDTVSPYSIITGQASSKRMISMLNKTPIQSSSYRADSLSKEANEKSKESN